MIKSEMKWRTFLDKIDKVFSRFKDHIHITSEIIDGRHRVIFCKTHDTQWFEKLESAISKDYELYINCSCESEPDKPFEKKYEFILPKLESKGIDMDKIEIQEETRIPGTDILLEKGDKIIWKEADDPKPKFICVSGEKDLKDSVKLPDRVVLTNNGAYDLEQKKMSGWYVWVGYEHEGSKSEPTMQSILTRTAEEVGRWMSKTYTGKYNVDNLWKTLDMFRVWVEDTSGKIQKELDRKKNEARVSEDSGLIERKVVFDEPLFQYVVEYRSEPIYSGRVNYYHVRDVKFESRLERRMHEFGFNAYFNDSGRGKYPSIGFSDLHKTYDMEEWLKVLNTLYGIMKKIADYEKTYVRIYY